MKKDPQLQVSWSSASSTMPRGAPLRQHRLARLGQRHAVPDADAELAGEVGVAHRLATSLGDELEQHVEDDVAAGAP